MASLLNFMKIPNGSKVISEGHTDSMAISLALFFFGEEEEAKKGK
jgi:hypothetical protein